MVSNCHLVESGFSLRMSFYCSQARSYPARFERVKISLFVLVLSCSVGSCRMTQTSSVCPIRGSRTKPAALEYGASSVALGKNWLFNTRTNAVHFAAPQASGHAGGEEPNRASSWSHLSTRTDSESSHLCTFSKLLEKLLLPREDRSSWFGALGT